MEITSTVRTCLPDVKVSIHDVAAAWRSKTEVVLAEHAQRDATHAEVVEVERRESILVEGPQQPLFYMLHRPVVGVCQERDFNDRYRQIFGRLDSLLTLRAHCVTCQE